MICPYPLSTAVTFLVSLMVSKVASWLMNKDNSETVYFLQKVKEDPNSFCCHFKASIYAYLIVYQTNKYNK